MCQKSFKAFTLANLNKNGKILIILIDIIGNKIKMPKKILIASRYFCPIRPDSRI